MRGSCSNYVLRQPTTVLPSLALTQTYVRNPCHLDLKNPFHPEAINGLLELLQKLVLEGRVRVVLGGQDRQLEIIRPAAPEGSVDVSLRVLALSGSCKNSG